MLLTLDLATRIGYTLGHLADPDFRVGHHDLPSTGPAIGEFAQAFNFWLSSLTANDRIDEVVFEAPVMPAGFVKKGKNGNPIVVPNSRIETLRKLYGLAWHTEWFFRTRRIATHEVNVKQVKKFLTGNGNADKPMMMRAAKDLGFNPNVHDEADAIAIRLMFLSVHHPNILRSMNLDMGLLGASVAKGRMSKQSE